MLNWIKSLIYRTLSYRVRNNHMTMLSGAKMYVFRPERSDPILVSDLAKAKSQLCRWGGNLPQFFSVAQHSVYAYRIAKANGMPWVVQFMALFHEVSEPVMGDQPSPVKRGMWFFRWTEDRFQHEAFIRLAAKANRYLNITTIKDLYPYVKEIDVLLLRAERVTLRNKTTGICSDRGKEITAHHDDPSIHDVVDPNFYWWTPEEAEYAFIQAAWELGLRYEPELEN